jgi:[protein-PII] uridylyltransferase
VRRFLDTMPDSYFLTTPELLLPAHADLVRRARAEGLATSVVHYPEREFSEFTAALPDRPGLFATLTGVLTASGMNIVGARIATSSDHVALDAFRVSHLERRQIALDDDRWASAGRLLAEVLAGEKDLGAILARAARPGILDRPRRRSGLLDVVVNNETSDHYTVIDVHGQDRMGLLYGLARTLFSLGLEIHLAKISTAVDQVLDVFYVTEANGRKTERVAEIREGLLAVLEPDREEQPPEASLEAPGASPG